MSSWNPTVTEKFPNNSGMRSTKHQLCASCAALEASGHQLYPRNFVIQRILDTVKQLFRILVYGITSVLIGYFGWLLYEEFFDCFWATAQSLVYTFIALLACTATLLSICKNNEFTVSSKMLWFVIFFLWINVYFFGNLGFFFQCKDFI